MYGGQAAASGVEGFKQGSKFQQDSQNAYRDAQLKEERIKEAVTNNKLLNIAYNDVAAPDQQTQQMQEMQQRLQTAEATAQKSAGSTVKGDVNELTVQADGKSRDDMIKVIKTRFKTNPEIYKSLGIKNTETMGILNPRDSKDRSWMTDTLAGFKVTPESEGVERGSKEWANIVDDMIDGYPAIKADGAIVDLNGLSVAMGASSMANPAHNKIMEGNRDILRKRIDGQVENPLALADMQGNERISAEHAIGYDQAGMAKDASIADIESQKASESMGITDIDRLKDKEGFRGNAYEDTEGHMTIGYGHKILPDEQHLLNTTLSKEDATKLLERDAQSHEKEFLAKEPWIKDLPEGAQQALADMAYNMGPNWLDKFPNTKKALQAGDMEKAAEGILDSKYAKQVGKRADENASLIRGDGGTASSEVAQKVSSEVASAGGKPLDDMRMRKVYSLLGKSYPRDPNEATAQMKNYEFLSNKVGDDKAFEAVFGGTDTKLGRMGKAMQERAQYSKDSTEYKEYTKFIEKLGKTGTASEVDFNRWTAELADPSTSPERRAELEEKIRDSMATSSEQTRDSNVKVMNEEQAKVEAMGKEVDSAIKTGKPISAESQASLTETQNKLRHSADRVTLDGDKKTLETMRGNQIAANGIASTLNRIESGDMKKIETGMVDNIVQELSTMAPEGMLTDDMKETMTANIKKNTTLGYLQASFIKAISGTAASNEEVQRLVKVMQGGAWSQPGAMKTALKEFYNTLEGQQKTHKGQLEVSPSSGYKSSMFTPMWKTRDEWTEHYGNDDRYDEYVTKMKGA